MMNTKEIKRSCDPEYSLCDSRTSGYESRGSVETGCRDGHFGKDPCTVRNNSGGIRESASEYASGRPVRGICMRSRTEDCGLSPR